MFRFALNLCIQAAQGEYIARVDAHTVYPSGYLNNCLQVYETTRAANVGGPVRSEGVGAKGKAIALAMSSKAGVGNSGFRTGGAMAIPIRFLFGFWK